jgi:hypothetical protein
LIGCARAGCDVSVCAQRAASLRSRLRPSGLRGTSTPRPSRRAVFSHLPSLRARSAFGLACSPSGRRALRLPCPGPPHWRAWHARRLTLDARGTPASRSGAVRCGNGGNHASMDPHARRGDRDVGRPAQRDSSGGRPVSGSGGPTGSAMGQRKARRRGVDQASPKAAGPKAAASRVERHAAESRGVGVPRSAVDSQATPKVDAQGT